jgi:hypothetical protein
METDPEDDEPPLGIALINGGGIVRCNNRIRCQKGRCSSCSIGIHLADLDESGVISADNDAPLPLGDASKEVSPLSPFIPRLQPTEEDLEKAGEERDNAQTAFADGDMAKAIEHYTNAIVLNPGSALLHAKRAKSVFISSCHICQGQIVQ